MDPRGVEPLSEKPSVRLSPSALRLQVFPWRYAGVQATDPVVFLCVTVTKTTHRSRSPLCHAQTEAAVLIGRTSPRQAARSLLLLLAFNFKFGAIMEVPLPPLAYRISNSPSKPLRARIYGKNLSVSPFFITLYITRLLLFRLGFTLVI